MPPGGFGGGGAEGHKSSKTNLDKPKNIKATLKNLAKYVGRDWWLMGFAIGIEMISIIVSIFCPQILGEMTNLIYSGVLQENGVNLVAIAKLAQLLIVFYILSASLRYCHDYIFIGVSERLVQRLRRDINQKINRLPLSYFDKVTHGEIMSYLTNDAETITTSLHQSLAELISSLVTLIGILIIMLSMSWLLTLVGLVVLPLSTLAVFFIVKKSQKFFIRLQKYLADLNGHVEEIYGGHSVMKLFNAENKEINQFKKVNNDLYQTTWKSQFLSSLVMPIAQFFGNLGYVLVCIVGGILTINGQMTVGGIQAFIIYVRNFNQPLVTLSSVFSSFQSTLAAGERIFLFLGAKEELDLGEKPLNPSEIKGAVTFDQVKFGYEPEKLVIKNFSSQIKAGQRIAIVGPTGAGKTTIVKLLMRFYDLNGGAIYLDDTNIADYSRHDLRTQLGMVLQDTWLFSGSVIENIRYGRPEASDAEVETAAEMAEADHFIKTLPRTYKFQLNEEATNISAGQKQLLTIARAILADPKVLIFDEATSSIDTRTEVNIQKAMNALMRNRTSFIIAHRLSTIRDADLILVINNGDIVEQGKHQELLEANGFYAQLYQSQFELSS